MIYILHYRSLTMKVEFQKKIQKCVPCGPFRLFYIPHNFPLRRNGSGFLWVKHIQLYLMTLSNSFILYIFVIEIYILIEKVNFCVT